MNHLTLKLFNINTAKLLCCFLAILMTGCAANMAAQGQNGPNMELVKQENNRRDIERYLGLPVEITPQGEGHYLAIYDVEARTEPNMTRAAGHATMDLFTFGLWEIIGGPTEVYMGRRVKVTVEYDENNQFVNLTSEQPPIL